MDLNKNFVKFLNMILIKPVQLCFLVNIPKLFLLGWECS